MDDPKVANLFNVLHSQRVAELNSTTRIYDTLIDPITDVINDQNSFERAMQWYHFSESVGKHIIHNQHFFHNMNFETSMCFQLWCYVYH